MKKTKFTDITSLSTEKIIEEISLTEREIFNLRFKKATRQTFKSHHFKILKKKLAQLKTFLTEKVEKMEGEEKNVLNELLSN